MWQVACGRVLEAAYDKGLSQQTETLVEEQTCSLTLQQKF